MSALLSTPWLIYLILLIAVAAALIAFPSSSSWHLQQP